MPTFAVEDVPDVTRAVELARRYGFLVKTADGEIVALPICPGCGTTFKPQPGRRGAFSMYCSSRCRVNHHARAARARPRAANATPRKKNAIPRRTKEEIAAYQIARYHRIKNDPGFKEQRRASKKARRARQRALGIKPE